MKIHFYDIEWDTDGKDTDLPTEVILDVDDDLSDDDLNDGHGADVLSDEFGFCVFGFDWEHCEQPQPS